MGDMNSIFRLSKGTLEEREHAFQLFVALGSKRAVARKLGRAVQTIHTWSKQDGWNDKINSIRENLPSIGGDDVTIVSKLQRAVLGALASGLVKIESWHDLLETQKFLYDVSRDSRYANLFKESREKIIKNPKKEPKPEVDPSPSSDTQINYGKYLGSAVGTDDNREDGSTSEVS